MNSAQAPIAYFNFKKNPIRTIQREDFSIWFVAKDVAVSLEIYWGSHTLDRIPARWRGTVKLTTPLKNQHGNQGFMENDTTIISEPAVYKLAFRSNKPEADEFTNWVASEVLPAIRTTGQYSIDEPAPKNQGHTPEQIAQAAFESAKIHGNSHNVSRAIAHGTVMKLTGQDITAKLPPYDPTLYKTASFIPDAVIKHLRTAREASGKSQRNVSLRIFDNPAEYGAIERGNLPLTPSTMDRILDYLGVDKDLFKKRYLNSMGLDLDDDKALTIPGIVFQFIHGVRKYFEMIGNAAEIEKMMQDAGRGNYGEFTREVGMAAGAILIELCLSGHDPQRLKDLTKKPGAKVYRLENKRAETGIE